MTTMTIYDSSPQMHSSFWAGPVRLNRYLLHFNAHHIYVYILKRVVDRILQILGGDSVNWIKWSRNVMTPAELDRQIDDWACGLFVLMVLHCFTLGIDYKRWCRDSAKENMRGTCLDHLINLPYVPPCWKRKWVNK